MRESGAAETKAAQDAGKQVITLDSRDGQDAVGVYAGPLVVTRVTTATGIEMW